MFLYKTKIFAEIKSLQKLQCFQKVPKKVILEVLLKAPHISADILLNGAYSKYLIIDHITTLLYKEPLAFCVLGPRTVTHFFNPILVLDKHCTAAMFSPDMLTYRF